MLVTVQFPVRLNTEPESIVITALLSTAVPFCLFSTMFIVPVKTELFVSDKLRVDIVSTAMFPLSVCPSAVNSTSAPLLPACPQPREALFPQT